MKSRLGAIGWAAVLLVGVAAHSAVVPVPPAPVAAVPGSGVPRAAGSAGSTVPAGPSLAPTFEQQWLDPIGLPVPVDAVRPVPPVAPAQVQPGASRLPSYAALLAAGRHVVESFVEPDPEPVPAEVSTVPLPGAIWLFGSGLVAFLGISARRKL